MTSSQIRQLIATAFRARAVPDEVVPLSQGNHLEREEVRRCFDQRPWANLSLEELKYHRQAVFFMTPRAWAFYLPAYMTAVADAYEQTDTMVDSIIMSMLPNTDSRIDQLRRQRLAELTESEADAVLAFVDWVAAEHPDDIEEDDREAIIAGIGEAMVGKFSGGG